MALSGTARRDRILQVVRGQGTMRVTDVAASVGISVVTARRDVALLAREGLVKRQHGSVSVPEAGSFAKPDGDNRAIGMLLPTVSSYFHEVIAGARATADAAGAQLVLGISPYEKRDDRGQVEALLESEIDGLLLTPHWHPGAETPDADWLTRLPVPAVLVERSAPLGSPAEQLDSVASDHRHGVLLALRHLASLGHRRILLAARGDTWTAWHTRTAYAEVTRHLGVEALPVVGIPAPDSPAAGGRARMEEVAQRIAGAAHEGVSAALVHNDEDALQLPPLLRVQGIRVPDDLALVAYDDVLSGLADPPLTAVAPPKRAVGAAALEMLLRRLAGGAGLPVHHLELSPTLKVRGSCGHHD